MGVGPRLIPPSLQGWHISRSRKLPTAPFLPRDAWGPTEPSDPCQVVVKFRELQVSLDSESLGVPCALACISWAGLHASVGMLRARWEHTGSTLGACCEHIESTLGSIRSRPTLQQLASAALHGIPMALPGEALCAHLFGTVHRAAQARRPVMPPAMPMMPEPEQPPGSQHLAGVGVCDAHWGQAELHGDRPGSASATPGPHPLCPMPRLHGPVSLPPSVAPSHCCFPPSPRMPGELVRESLNAEDPVWARIVVIRF